MQVISSYAANQMNVTSRILLPLVCILSLAACTSYRPIPVNGKVAIFPVEQNDFFKAVRVIVDVYKKYEPEMDAMGPKEGESARGRADFGFYVKQASGKLENGNTVRGIVLLEKVKIRGKETLPGQRQKVVNLIDLMRKDIANTFKSRWEPQYVVSYDLE
jgi:hypothetical protein